MLMFGFALGWLLVLVKPGLDDEVEGWLPLLPEVSLPRLTGQMLYDVVHRKSATAGSLDGWGWRELKVLPVSMV